MAKKIVKEEFIRPPYTLTDFKSVVAILPVWTKVIIGIYKERGKTLIGLLESLAPGEVIRMGHAPKTYKIMSIYGYPKRGSGRIYEIKRTDNVFCSDFDINNSPVGSDVRIVSRKTYDQLLEENTFPEDEL